MTAKRAALYVRVSTNLRTRDAGAFEQNPEVQEARSVGWQTSAAGPSSACTAIA
jgi:hypothetical protein